jgi:O-antigen/teichoic acid export membrane protein
MAWHLQRRFLVYGSIGALLLAVLLHPLLDEPGLPSRALMIALATISAASAVILQFSLGTLQLRERFLAFGSWLLLNSSVRILAWTVLWAIGALDLVTTLAAHIASSVVIAIALRHRTRLTQTPVAPSVAAADRAQLIRFGGRMVLASSIAATAAQIDLFMLDARADDIATARMRIAMQLALVLELATSAVMTALLPQAGRSTSPADIRATMRRAAACGVVVAVLALISLPVVQWALPQILPRYAEAADLYPIVLLGVVITALTDPLGLSFISRDRPGRFVWLNVLMLLVIVLGNLFVPGDDRAVITAWVRSCGRFVLGAGILLFLLHDSMARSKAKVAS